MRRRFTTTVLFAVLTVVSLGPGSADDQGNVVEGGADDFLATELEFAEYDIQDQCMQKAEALWEIITTSTASSANTLQEALEDLAGEYRQLSERYREKTASNLANRRKLELLSHPGDYLLQEDEYQKLAMFTAELKDIQKNAVINCYNPSVKKNEDDSCKLTLQEARQNLYTARNAEEALHLWTEAQEVYASHRNRYLPTLGLVQEAATANGMDNAESYWLLLSEYNATYRRAEQLWEQVQPLYNKLQSYVFRQLSAKYNLGNETAIPAHLLGTLAANDWSGLADVLLPAGKTYNHIQLALQEKSLAGRLSFEAAIDYVKSLGLPWKFKDTFFFRSQFTSTCDTLGVHLCEQKEARVTTCATPGWKQLMDVYETTMRLALVDASDGSPLLRDAPRYSAVVEALTVLPTLLATSADHLSVLGITDALPREDILLLVALRTLPRLPYHLLADQWRLNLLQTTENVTSSWALYRQKYQNITAPQENKAWDDYLDDPQITSNQPYLAKFLGSILQFQMLEVLQKQKHTTDLAKAMHNHAAMQTLVRAGTIRDWPQLLRETLEITDVDAAPLLRYFDQLETFLDQPHVRRSPLYAAAAPTSKPSDSTGTSNATTTTEDVAQPAQTSHVTTFVIAGVASIILVVTFFIYGRKYLRKRPQYAAAQQIDKP